MSARWRVALAAVIAAVIVGGFLPHGVLSLAGDASATTEMLQAGEAPFAALPNCADICGKGSPASPVPTPMVALAGVLSAVALAAVLAARARRRPDQVVPLPAGAPDRLLRPPQFS